jgi:hypothetical protein
VSSKDPRDRKQIWPDDCCEEHRTLDEAKKYMGRLKDERQDYED